MIQDLLSRNKKSRHVTKSVQDSIQLSNVFSVSQEDSDVISDFASVLWHNLDARRLDGCLGLSLSSPLAIDHLSAWVHSLAGLRMDVC